MLPGILFIVVVVIYLILQRKVLKPKNSEGKARPPLEKKPGKEMTNDKLIIIRNVSFDDLNIDISEFCDTYNANDFAAVLRVWKVSSNKFAITFPFDTDFNIFCFLINSLQYPGNVEWNAEITGWMTPDNNSAWKNQATMNKKWMVYIPADDTEYDQVYFTTPENTGYQLDFGSMAPKKLAIIKMNYRLPEIELLSPGSIEFEDFE
jgi:hypothetical protein